METSFSSLFLPYYGYVMTNQLYVGEGNGVTGENQPLILSHWQLSHLPRDSNQGSRERQLAVSENSNPKSLATSSHIHTHLAVGTDGSLFVAAITGEEFFSGEHLYEDAS